MSLATGAGKSSILNAILDGKQLSTSDEDASYSLHRQRCSDQWNERYARWIAPVFERLNKLLACTAVVTEIAYHSKPTIDADVSFLSFQDWKQELSVLLTDLVDEDGNLKRSTDLKSDAGIAWQKVCFPLAGQTRAHTLKSGPRSLSEYLSRGSCQA
jgi:hypothetical protein